MQTQSPRKIELHLYFFGFGVSRPSQTIRVMSGAISLPNHNFPGQAWSFKRLTSICDHSFARNW